MNQPLENTQIQNVVLFKTFYKDLVNKIVSYRKESGANIEDIAFMLKVDKRKISAFEKLKKIDLETLLKYADKMSIDVKVSFEVT